MYAIAFDLKIDDLKKAYGEPYNRAYDEIRQEMEALGFNWTQGSLYINSSNTDNLGPYALNLCGWHNGSWPAWTAPFRQQPFWQPFPAPAFPF